MSMIEDEYIFGSDTVEQPAKRFRYTDIDGVTSLSAPSEFVPLSNGGGGGLGGAPAAGVKPSKVLQLRGLPPSCAEIEVISVMRRQAPVVDCFLLSNKGQALVEFECVEDAEHVLQMQHQRQCINISNCVPQIAFSPIQSITTNDDRAAPTGSTSSTTLISSGSSGNISGPDSGSSGFYGDSHHVSSHHRSAGSGGGSSSHYLDSDYHSGGSSSKASNYPHHSLSSSSSSSYNRSIAASMTARPDEHYMNGATGAATAVRMENGGGKEQSVNKVLLFTILRPDYPIDVKVILDVCNKFNCAPQKIYIFRRRGVQAMVEFPDTDTAVHIKKSLDGADIYSGCCTLRIEYARPETLKVTRNTEDTYNAKLAAEEGVESGRVGRLDPGLLPPPENVHHPQMGGGGGGSMYRQIYDGGAMALRTGRGAVPMQVPEYDGRGLKTGPPVRGGRRREGDLVAGRVGGAPERETYYVPIDDIGPGGLVSYGRGGGGGMYAGGGAAATAADAYDYTPSVLMIHNLHEEKFGPQKLFNLLCIFGNVNKVKFLKSKPGSAMVEMQGSEAASKIMSVLPSLDCFGKKLSPKISKQQELFENTRVQAADSIKMPNGEPYFVNFTTSRDQRFSSANEKAKNRFQYPKKTLHAFNMPAGTTEDAVMKAFEDAGAPVPQYVSFMESKYKEEAKKTTANVVFHSITEATEALVLTNHCTISDSAGRKLTLRLCFSSGKGTE